MTSHSWDTYICTQPATCTTCGETSGSALGHKWVDASCTSPRYCTDCGKVDGTALGHDYVDYVCARCGDDITPLGYTLGGTIISYLTKGDVKVELVQGGEVVYSTTPTDGSYVIEGVAAGTYVLRVSKDNHVTREYEITVGDENVTQDAKICPIGDVTGDGMVNIKDFQRMLRHVNESKLLEGYALLCGDVTGDGDVTIKDFQRLLRHVNESKPLF